MSSFRMAGFAVSLTASMGAVVALSFGLTPGCGSTDTSNGLGNGPGEGGAMTDGAPVSMGDGGGPTGDSGGRTDTGAPGRDSGKVPDGSSGPCTTNTGAISGTVGGNGGSISRLVFAVVGDTRPVNEDDPGSYPTAIITKIYQDIEAQSPHPPFVLATGDYQFSSTGSGSTADQQVGIYMQARKAYTGASFPAMGNHECGVSGPYSGSTEANCGPGNPGGATPNYNAFMSQMLAPINQANPYYAINVNATDGSWTAKFVITAANAWDTAQQTWLQTTMAQKTTYTFIVRHEASDATPPLPPGVAGVDAVIANYPYTMMINGHAHTYYWYYGNPNKMTVGNGGAPLSSKTYGYALFSQRCDGPMVVDMYDYMTGATDPKFHFVITPDGKETQ